MMHEHVYIGPWGACPHRCIHGHYGCIVHQHLHQSPPAPRPKGLKRHDLNKTYPLAVSS